MAPSSKSKHLGLSIAIGVAIGALAAVLSGHMVVWLAAGFFVGVAVGSSYGRKECPKCEAREVSAVARSKQ